MIGLLVTSTVNKELEDYGLKYNNNAYFFNTF